MTTSLVNSYIALGAGNQGFSSRAQELGSNPIPMLTGYMDLEKYHLSVSVFPLHLGDSKDTCLGVARSLGFVAKDFISGKKHYVYAPCLITKGSFLIKF